MLHSQTHCPMIIDSTSPSIAQGCGTNLWGIQCGSQRKLNKDGLQCIFSTSHKQCTYMHKHMAIYVDRKISMCNLSLNGCNFFFNHFKAFKLNIWSYSLWIFFLLFVSFSQCVYLLSILSSKSGSPAPLVLICVLGRKLYRLSLLCLVAMPLVHLPLSVTWGGALGSSRTVQKCSEFSCLL